MKPSKNKVFCYDCGRNKMLFETEKKANTFLKFNAGVIEEESGKRPIRSYFCQSCCGWHITSQEDKPKHISRTEKVINLYNKAKEEEMKSEKEEITNNIQKAQNGDFVYIGLFLTEESRNKLYDIFTIPLESKVYMEHCTLLFKRTQMEHKNAQKVIDAYVNQLNKKNHNVTLIITAIGYSDKVIAVKVNPNVPCCNDVPHITLCTLNDGKPSDSNNITKWRNLDTPIKVKGIWQMV